MNEIEQRQPESLCGANGRAIGKNAAGTTLGMARGCGGGVRRANHTLRAQESGRGHLPGVLREGRGESFLPADPKTIRVFIEHEVNCGKKPATVRRYIATIGRGDIGAGLLNPCSGEAVRLALKKMAGRTSARQAGQARALGWGRDQAIHWEAPARGSERIAMAGRCYACAYETLARRGEPRGARSAGH